MRSKLEETCRDLLISHGIIYEYEKQKVVLLEGFKYTFPLYEREGKVFKEYLRKVLPITYTPDFVGDGWVIETKGYEKESSKIKWKLFKKYILNNNIDIMLFKPHTKKEILECLSLIKEKSKNEKITKLCSQQSMHLLI